MDEVTTILTGLNSDSAKQRERVIKSLAPSVVQEPQVLEKLQQLVSADPVEYVREAARAQLLAAGQTPRESIAPVQLKQEGAAKPAAFAIGCVIIPIVICVVVAILMVAVLAIMGPQIGNIFSRITNDLASP